MRPLYTKSSTYALALALKGKPLNISKHTLAHVLGTKNLLPAAQRRNIYLKTRPKNILLSQTLRAVLASSGGVFEPVAVQAMRALASVFVALAVVAKRDKETIIRRPSTRIDHDIIS
jgi:hypothetical protein